MPIVGSIKAILAEDSVKTAMVCSIVYPVEVARALVGEREKPISERTNLEILEVLHKGTEKEKHDI